MIGLLLVVQAALGAPAVSVLVEDGPLRPGRSAALQVSVSDGTRPLGARPGVEVVGGLVRTVRPLREGVWQVIVEPDVDAETLEVVARAAGATGRMAEAVRVPEPSPLELPATIDGSVRDPRLTFLVTGAEVPPVDALEVVLGEGAVEDLQPVPDGVEVTVVLEEQPFPREVLVGVRDRRGDLAPRWGRIRLRARPRLPLQADPGSELTLIVGGREYGPFEADADGNISASVDQYPGERVASAIFTDDLGNETRTDVPLVSPAGVGLVAMPSGEALPGRAPPLVFLAAGTQDGSSWDGAAPACRTPAVDLPVRALGGRGWYASLPPLVEAEDVRVECTVAGTSQVFRVRVEEGVATDLRLRVWPDELRSDLPYAEVRAVIEDVRGERLDVDGVQIRADRGAVALSSASGIVARGEYDGAEALEAGEDRVVATWDPPRGEGAPRELDVAWSAMPSDAGEVQVHGRALDARRRPLSGVTLELTAGGSGAQVVTGPDGWASATLAVEPAGRALAIGAATTWLRRRSLVLPGEAAVGGPGAPTLTDARAVTISPSRVSGISVDVEPAILRAGPGALAWIYVRLEDRSGRPVTDEEVRIEVTEGVVGEVHTRSDGTIVAAYEPDADEGSREVVVTARTDTLRSSARLLVEPRVVRLSLGPWVGYQTNFGAVSAPVVGADVDVRTRVRPISESLLFRGSIHGYSFRSVAETGVGSAANLQSAVVPLTGAVLLRDDRGPWAFWGGGGGALAVHRLEVRFGDDLVSTGSRILGGPTLIAGGSRRLLGGELLLTLRASWLPARREEVGYTGNVGGLAAGLGYRLVY